MEQITHILIVNLERRPDLWERLGPVLQYFRETWPGIQVQRVNAIDFVKDATANPLLVNDMVLNQELSINASGLRRLKASVLGEIGCFLSHKKCWHMVVDQVMDHTLIIEDGILFYTDRFTNQIPSGYDIIYTNKEMNRIAGRLMGYGTQSYIVSQTGAKKLLKLCQMLASPIDLQMRSLCQRSQLTWHVLRPYWTENNQQKISSVSGQSVETHDLNAKQDMNSFGFRILKNMLDRQIPLLNFI